MVSFSEQREQIIRATNTTSEAHVAVAQPFELLLDLAQSFFPTNPAQARNYASRALLPAASPLVPDKFQLALQRVYGSSTSADQRRLVDILCHYGQGLNSLLLNLKPLKEASPGDIQLINHLRTECYPDIGAQSSSQPLAAGRAAAGRWPGIFEMAPLMTSVSGPDRLHGQTRTTTAGPRASIMDREDRAARATSTRLDRLRALARRRRVNDNRIIVNPLGEQVLSLGVSARGFEFRRVN